MVGEGASGLGALMTAKLAPRTGGNLLKWRQVKHDNLVIGAMRFGFWLGLADLLVLLL